MKLAVIGGGGVRSAFLARSIARRAAALGLTSVVFMDTDREKLRVFGGMSRQVAARLAPRLDFRLTSSLEEAVEDADYVITTIRSGGDASRARDERFALNLGLLGQETTGAGGFLMASRTIPALIECCEAVRKHARPGALVFNFSNPAGLVVQALRDLGFRNTYGVCDAPSGFLRQVAALYGRSAAELESLCFGLNHLSYFSSVKLDGRELVQELLGNERLYSATDMRFFEPALAKRIGMLLNEYLYYFYYRERAVSNITGAGACRGELIEDCNRRMLAELAPLDMDRDFDEAVRIFEKWYDVRERNYMAKETGSSPRANAFSFRVEDPDDGGYAGVALGYMDTVSSGERREMVLNVPNQGSIGFLSDDDVVELSCTVDRDGIHPKPIRAEVREPEAELIRRVKAYERLAARSICTRDESLAVDALFLHPLIASYSLAKEIARQAFGDRAAGR